MVRLASRLSRSLLVAGIGVFLTSVAFAVPIYNPVTDFSITNNPNGVWSLGTESTLGGAFTAFSTPTANCTTANYQVWNNGGLCTAGPSVANNATGGQFIGDGGSMTQQTTELSLNPSSTLFSVVRWTAPSTGVWSITGFFRAIDTMMATQGSDVHVVVNGSLVFSAGAFTYLLQQPINLTETLLAGQTIDFAVGNGGSATNAVHQFVGLTTEINAAPEPSSVILIGIGSALLVAVRKRRARA